MAPPSKSFHALSDREVRPHLTYSGGQWVPAGHYVTFLNRSVEYQFFPHFHPYVTPLIQRLNDGGFRELQDSDTLYLPQPNPPLGQPLKPLTAIPDSTRATLAANVAATRPDGTALPLTAGTPLTLLHGTMVTVSAGTTVSHPDGTSSKLAADAAVQLPAELPVSSSSGIQSVIAGVDSIVIDGTAVVLANGPTVAVLAADGTRANLPNGTALVLRSGLPQPYFYNEFFARYSPNAQWVQEPYPVKDIDFTSSGAYSIYNWELFFHAPLLIAVHLSQNQKFQEAQRWFHYIFNPTDNSTGPTPERFWRVKPFQYTDVKMIEEILVNLSSQHDPGLYTETINSISDWKQNPFQPFAVAKHRPTAYMMKTVMAYLDNLIAWGDSLFQQYTIETVNEATQIYVLAAQILGRKPQAVPKKGSVKPLTYSALRGKLDAFSNALVDMEADIPFDLAPLPSTGSTPQGTQTLDSIGQTLYFCIPRNDKLLHYWDTVADRLFKIHNSLNLQGVFQRLPLYDPPIDPALLVRAAAAGLDVSAIVNGLNQPLPLVRFQVLVAKAAEICQEVKSLGAGILAAMEKQDNESLSLMRSQHESIILGLTEMVKYSQWQDAIKARQGLEQSLANVTARYSYYQKLLGRTDAQIKSSIPQLDALDSGSLQNLAFSQSDATGEPQIALDPINPDIAKDSTSVSDGELTTLSGHEVEELNKLALGRDFQITASSLEAVGSVLAIIPNFKAHGQPMGMGLTVDFGGPHLHSMMSGLASVARAVAEEYAYEGNKTAKLGSYSRRELEWVFQSNSAKGEINQIFKQLRGAQIREAIASREYDNHKTQMEHAQAIVDFLQGNDPQNGFQVKETTVGFYAWMKREAKALYARTFQLAFEVAKKAERALQNELGNPELSYIQFGYLDGTEGLMAGEKLLFDVRVMEMAYHDLNQREYELTKHVSLLQLDPLALVQLRATGSCSFTLTEELFDIDIPLPFRRTKSIAVTLPCVTGPYTGVNCTLTLQKSSIRTSTDVAEGYARKGSDDPRFNDYYGSMQSIVTSSAQSDSGLFETNLRDERYLPFEGTGVAGSQWQLTLPSDVRQFAFDTISDVVLHVRYTAREGGDEFKAAAMKNLNDQIAKAQTVGSVRLFSIRHEFPAEWAKFQSAAIAAGTPTAALSLKIRLEHYPFWARGIVDHTPMKPVQGVQFFAEMSPSNASTTVSIHASADKSGAAPDVLTQNPAFGDLLAGSLATAGLPLPLADAAHPAFTRYFDNNSMEDLWMAITWGGKRP